MRKIVIEILGLPAFAMAWGADDEAQEAVELPGLGSEHFGFARPVTPEADYDDED